MKKMVNTGKIHKTAKLAHYIKPIITMFKREKAMKSTGNPTLWRILLLFSLVVAIISLISLAYLQVNISGDGIPNRPQGGPPVEYPWARAQGQATAFSVRARSLQQSVL